MTTLLSVFPTFQDLKQKSSGKGGLSDGGCICKSDTLTSSTPVVIAPPKGVNWGGIAISSEQRVSLVPGGVTGWNFDATTSCKVEEYLVFEDGTEVLTGAAAILAANTGITSHAHVSPFFAANGILSFPNKLKYKMVANGQAALPTARVLVKTALVEYDQPSDEV
jgi:hypothetical protein